MKGAISAPFIEGCGSRYSVPAKPPRRPINAVFGGLLGCGLC
jgi:hypothetical protein